MLVPSVSNMFNISVSNVCTVVDFIFQRPDGTKMDVSSVALSRDDVIELAALITRLVAEHEAKSATAQ